MPINGYRPDYKGNKSKIISEEKGRKHIAENPNRCMVTHYRVDGVILVNEKACDYILINEDSKTAYLIELKGCRVDKAAEQLRATAEKFKKELRGYMLQFRIVTSESPSRGSRTTRLKKSSLKIIKVWENNRQFRIQTTQLTDNI